ncbi:MAG: hypothetical protein QXI11_05690 [Thermoproteota archaeon]
MTQEIKRFSFSTLAKTVISYSLVIATLWFAAAEAEKVLGTRLAYFTSKIIMGSIIALIFAMFASLIKNLMRGVLIERLVIFLEGVALSLFLYYSLDAFLAGSIISSILYQYLIFCITFYAYAALLPYVEARSPIVLKSVLKAITVTVMTYAILNSMKCLNLDVLQIPTQPNRYVMIHLESIITTGWVLLTISILVGMLRGAKSTLLRSLAKIFPKEAASFLLGTLLTLYLLDLRPLLSAFLFYIEVVEWATIGITIMAGYMLLRREIIPESKDLLPADWRKHVQVVDITKDSDFEEATRIINAFVESSKKEPLVVYLIYMLAQKSIPREEAEKALAGIINYSSPYYKPTIFSWDLNYILAQEKLERLKCVKETLTAIDKIMSSRVVEVKG